MWERLLLDILVTPPDKDSPGWGPPDGSVSVEVPPRTVPDDQCEDTDSYVISGLRLVILVLAAGSIVFLLRNDANTCHKYKVICFLALVLLYSGFTAVTGLDCDHDWAIAAASFGVGLFPLALDRLVLERVMVLGATLGWQRTVLCMRRAWQTLVITTACSILLLIMYFAHTGDGEAMLKPVLEVNLVMNSLFHIVFLSVAVRVLVDPVISLRAALRTLWGQERRGELSVFYSFGLKQLVAIVISLITGCLTVIIKFASASDRPIVEGLPGIAEDIACIGAAVALSLTIRNPKRKEAQDLMLEAERERKRKNARTRATYQPCEDLGWQGAVEELAYHGFTLEQFLIFFKEVLPELMPHYDPRVSTTTDVVRHAVIPGSQEDGCAYAAKMMRGIPTRPKTFVTHNWNNLFCDLLAAILADALRQPTFAIISHLLSNNLSEIECLLKPEDLAKTYWVCAFSVNQHISICGANPYKSTDSVTGLEHPVCPCKQPKFLNDTPPLRSDGKSVKCQMNKFDDVMTFLTATDDDFTQLVAADCAFTLFSRAWCVAELAEADNVGMQQKLQFHSYRAFDWAVPKLQNLRIQDMNASRPEDVHEILSKIPDVDGFNIRLHNLLFGDMGMFTLWNLEDCLQFNDELGVAARFAKTVAHVSDKDLPWYGDSWEPIQRISSSGCVAAKSAQAQDACQPIATDHGSSLSAIVSP